METTLGKLQLGELTEGLVIYVIVFPCLLGGHE